MLAPYKYDALRLQATPGTPWDRYVPNLPNSSQESTLHKRRCFDHQLLQIESTVSHMRTTYTHTHTSNLLSLAEARHWRSVNDSVFFLGATKFTSQKDNILFMMVCVNHNPKSTRVKLFPFTHYLALFLWLLRWRDPILLRFCTNILLSYRINYIFPGEFEM